MSKSHPNKKKEDSYVSPAKTSVQKDWWDTRKQKRTKHAKRARKEKTECAICRQEFTPENEEDKVCRLDACQSLQRNIASGDSDLPSTHPDYYDKTEDPEYLRLPSTDDEAISEEKERKATVEAKQKNPQKYLSGGKYTGGPRFTRDQCIEDHDGNVVRTYPTSTERIQAINYEAGIMATVKAHLNSVIEKYARSG
jgi:hypothetical protein